MTKHVKTIRLNVVMKRDEKYQGIHSFLYDIVFDYHSRYVSYLGQYKILAAQSKRENDRYIYSARIAEAERDIKEMEDVLSFMEKRYKRLSQSSQKEEHHGISHGTN